MIGFGSTSQEKGKFIVQLSFRNSLTNLNTLPSHRGESVLGTNSSILKPTSMKMRMKKRKKEKKGSSRMVCSFPSLPSLSHSHATYSSTHPAVDNFIVDRREPRQERDGSLPPGDDDVDFGDTEDGDASHRRLDRRRMAKKDQEAAALAEELDARYKKNKYKAGENDDWAPQALLMPSVNDPSIWGVKCKVCRDMLIILSRPTD